VGKRHLSRQTALQLLYAAEFMMDDTTVIAEKLAETGEIDEKSVSPFSLDLANKVRERREMLDVQIKSVLENWRIERLSKVDLNILRLALCEMESLPDVPIRVTLNEYIELAKQFGTDESAGFVNGILDKLGRKFADKDFRQGYDKKQK
jgi:transcription antitermination protein NusB